MFQLHLCLFESVPPEAEQLGIQLMKIKLQRQRLIAMHLPVEAFFKDTQLRVGKKQAKK